MTPTWIVFFKELRESLRDRRSLLNVFVIGPLLGPLMFIVLINLVAAREQREADHVAIVRVEQLYPFPLKALTTELSRFKNAEVIWCQEEPKNQGAWAFVQPYVEWLLENVGAKNKRARYVGRAASASTATGLMSMHTKQLQQFLEEALG